MTVLEILCHPKPGSFNLALASSARETLNNLGHDVIYHDLYKEGFDPVLSASELSRAFSLDEQVQLYCEEVSSSDGMVIFHPDWWCQPPAMLKGWVDRVFRQGIAYDLVGDEFVEKGWKPLLTGKKGLVFCTSDEPERDGSRALESLWTDGILRQCGMEAECSVFRDMRRAYPSKRREWMRFVESTIREWFRPRPGSPSRT